ncbi:MAG: Ig-like domain-containing protein [Lachnospiraceae bacterium]|nr:Ig-like domain-containing protein [Lachnospiraceae bacterium]
MKQYKNNLIKVLGFVLFFGLCIFMVSGVNAKAAGSDPKLNLESCEVTVGGTVRLRVYNLDGRTVIYTSSDPSIVTVTNVGKLKGRNCGDAVITAYVFDKGALVSTLQCDVHTGPAAVSIKFTSNKLVLKEGGVKQIYPLVIPKNTVETPLYNIEDESIAWVSAAGIVKAKSVGSTDLYGYIRNGEFDVCQVVVLSVNDYDDYRIGKRSLDDILSDKRSSNTQNEQANEEEATTEAVKESTVAPTPTPAPTVTPVINGATTPVAGK